MTCDSNKTRRRRRREGLCARCGAKSTDHHHCEPCREAVNLNARTADQERKDAIAARAREQYAARVKAGRCGRCGNKRKPDGTCGICGYLKRVWKRGGKLQGVIDGSCVAGDLARSGEF